MGVIGLLGSVTARQWAPFTAAFLQGFSETGIVAADLPVQQTTALELIIICRAQGARTQPSAGFSAAPTR